MIIRRNSGKRPVSAAPRSRAKNDSALPLLRGSSGALLAVGMALSLAACGDTPRSAEEHINRAEKAHEQGDLATALIEIRNALRAAPEDADARRLFGLYSLESGESERAVRALMRAQELGVDPQTVRVPLARAQLELGDLEAVLSATADLESLPEDQQLDGLVLRGRAHLAGGNLEAAANDFTAALEQQEVPRARLGMAWIALLQSDYETARSHVDTVLEETPDAPDAWELRGDIANQAGEQETADTAYGQAMALGNDVLSATVKRALLRIRHGDLDGARSDIQTLTERPAKHPEISYAAGLLAFAEERYSSALGHFEQTLALNNNHLLAVFYLGASHFAQGNWSAAERHLTRFSKRYPEVASAQRLLAQTHLRIGDPAQAETALRSILSQDGEDLSALRQIGQLYLAQGRNEEAVQALRRAAAIDSDSPSTRIDYGTALLRSGETDAASRELAAAGELDLNGADAQQLRLIYEQLRAGQTAAALESATRYQQRNPQDATVSTLIGMAHVQREAFDAATAAFEEALEHDPGRADAAYNLAILYLRQDDPRGSIAVIERALEANPGHQNLSILLAQLYAREDRTEESIAALEAALEAHPAALTPRLSLASLHTQNNQIDTALRVLEGGRAWHHNNPLWLRETANARLLTGNASGASELLEALLVHEPNQADIYFALGRARAASNRATAALEAMEQGLELAPEQHDARRATVQLYIEAGRLDEAAATLQPLRTARPDDLLAIAQEAHIALHRNTPERAVALLEKAVAERPQGGSLRALLADAQWAAGNHEEAIAVLQHRLEEQPQDLHAQLRLSSRYLALDRHSEATRVLERSVDLAPNNPLVLNNLAWAIRESDPDRAVTLIERAVALAPKAPPILDTLGTIQLQRGDYNAALTSFRRATALDPDDPALRLNLARAFIATNRQAEAQSELTHLVNHHPTFEALGTVNAMLEEINSQ